MTAADPATSRLTLPGPFRAVVCDMDGLLVQTERQWLQAKLVLFGRYGAELHEDDLAAVFGASELESARYFAARFGLDLERIPALRDEYLAIVTELFEQQITLTVGAAELMARLGGRVPLAVASNSRRSLMRIALAAFPPSVRFDVVVSGEEARPKPSPDLYLLACERLHVEPRDAVALEDSPTGVRAAQAAGLTCIGVPSDPRHPLQEADLVVPSLLELVEDVR
jgi:HAD superfamily hydrolase (TIGR01509 family)